MMTTVIITTRGRPDMLKRCLESLWGATGGLPGRTVVAVDNCPETERAMFDPGFQEFDWVDWWHGRVQRGFWQTINWVLETVPEDEPFCYFGKDVLFRDGWLEAAEKCWRERVLGGLGLLAFRDDMQDANNASHGMTTRRWLRVLNDDPFFPRGFWHFHCDSELTMRSKDLGRFVYCAESHVPHLHEQTGHQDSIKPEQLSDYELNNQRHVAWYAGEMRQARSRLQAMS